MTELPITQVVCGEKYPILAKAGYFESRRKPGLYYKSINSGVFFMDFRQTKAYSGFESLGGVLFYLKLSDGIPPHRYWFLMKGEAKRLWERGWKHCQTLANQGSISLEWLLMGELPTIICECPSCQKFLMEKKRRQRRNKEKRIKISYDFTPLRMVFGLSCVVCGELIHNLKKALAHHISYDPEVKVLIHRSCHTKIHASKEYPILKPDRDQTSFRKRKKRTGKRMFNFKALRCLFAVRCQRCSRVITGKIHEFVIAAPYKVLCSKCNLKLTRKPLQSRIEEQRSFRDRGRVKRARLRRWGSRSSDYPESTSPVGIPQANKYIPGRYGPSPLYKPTPKLRGKWKRDLEGMVEGK